MTITDTALKFSTSVVVLMFVLAFAGALAYAGLPREAAPDVEMPIILVTTPYFGVSPTDIEALVTNPIERELKELKNVDTLASTSAEGASLISIKFNPGVDIGEAHQEVRDKMDLASPKLPEDAEDPIINTISSSDFPVMIVNISSEYNEIRLRQVADDLQEKLEAVPGVLEVSLAGGVEREVQVNVDPGRLNHYGLSLRDVENAIIQDNISLPGGDIKLGDASFLVRVPGEFENVDQLANIIIKQRGGYPVYLTDIAEVKDGFKDRDTISRIDGHHNVSLTVTKQPGENLLSMADDIKKTLAREQPLLPAGTVITILADASTDIEQMVKELQNNILSGLILVIAVIMVAMGFRNSVLVGLAIPLSMLISFLVLSMLDITLNMVVLFSLILALGMLVDNSIVVVENIYRHLCEGKDRVQASLVGTREVAWPVLTSTMTTVAAFGPLIFWPGIMGKFMGFLPKTLIITLLASLFVALVITPVLCALMMKRDSKESKNDEGRLQAYEDALRRALSRRGLTVAVGAVVFIGTFALYGVAGLGVELFPEVEPRKIFIDMHAGDGAQLGATDRVARQLEVILAQPENVDHFVADIGVAPGEGGIGGGKAKHRGRVTIDFLAEDDRVEGTELTVERIRNNIQNIAGARLEIKKEQMGPPAGPPVNLELYSDEFEELGAFARKVREKIANVPGLVDLKDDFESGRPEVRVIIDRQRAKMLGTNTQAIAGTVRTAVHGSKASVLRDGDDEIDIVVRLQAAFRNRLSDLEALRINVASRKDPDETFLVPIGQVATLTKGGGAGAIRHNNSRRVVTVSAHTEGRLPNAVLLDVQEIVKQMKIPQNITYAFTGQDKEQKKTEAFLAKAFLGALFLIALVLITQFNSLVQPMVIMLAVVLSLVGVFWGQLILQLPFGIIMTGLGVISLAGIVVNNGIVLVDYVQQLRAQGMPREEALVKAGSVRLRPVLLTAITTILGLVPMALGVSIDFATMSLQLGGRMADFWRSMSVAVIFGLTIATVLTLVVVPVLYSLLDDLEMAIRRVLGMRPRTYVEVGE